MFRAARLCRFPATAASRRFFAAGKGSSRQESFKKRQRESNKEVAFFMGALTTFTFLATYASVPLYKVFCSVTGFGGTTQRADDTKAANVKPVDGGRILTVHFDATVPDSMPWQFTPTQRTVKLVPGETALAFYTAKNLSKNAVTGVATYNVFPDKTGLYFNKIQCFCFEEQRLGPLEEVDMPVFFYIDPDIMDDVQMKDINEITLSYTFFCTGVEEPEEEEEETAPKAAVVAPVVVTTASPVAPITISGSAPNPPKSALSVFPPVSVEVGAAPKL